MTLALNFALDSAGNNIAARIAMIAMTTSSSIKVKAERLSLLVLMVVSFDKKWTGARGATRPTPRTRRSISYQGVEMSRKNTEPFATLIGTDTGLLPPPG